MTAALVVRNQVKVYNNRQMRAQAVHALEIRETQARGIRQKLFDLLQPVALVSCDLQRW